MNIKEACGFAAMRREELLIGRYSPVLSLPASLPKRRCDASLKSLARDCQMADLAIATIVIVRRSQARVAHCDASLPKGLAELLWREPNALVDRGEPLRCVGARRTVRLQWGSQRFVLKHYVEPTRRHALKQAVQPSRAWSTWSAVHRLANAGIATPRPVACVENRWACFRGDSFLMYPYVEGRTVRSYFARQEPAAQSTNEILWRQLNELWHRLRQLRVSLADTNLGNFIVAPDGQLWVIDLDKARFHRLASTAGREQQRGWRQLLRSAAKCQLPNHTPRERHLASWATAR
jgi:hypothetical protein